MARKLTINERDVLVAEIYNKVSKASIEKLEKDLADNQDFLNIKSIQETIIQNRKTAEDLTEKLDDLVEDFNKTLATEHFKLAKPFYHSIDTHFQDVGLRRKIESEVVIANLGDSVDFDLLTQKLMEKYGA